MTIDRSRPSRPIFPDRAYAHQSDYAADYFSQLAAAAADIDLSSIDAAARMIEEVVHGGGTIFTCGNGGSAAIANHLACDCQKGMRTGTDLRPKVHSLSTTVELITAIANDLSYEQVFAHQLGSHGRAGDMLIAISSSGNSPNILAALRTAHALRLRTLAMVGFDGGISRQLADVSLFVRSSNYGIVEDIHQSLMHMMAQFLRQRHLTDPSMIGTAPF